jgi:hypothetical protein
MEPNMLTSVRLPLPWDEFDLPNPLATRVTVLGTGDPAWGWGGATPDLGVPATDDDVAGVTAPGWDLDHVVLLVPDLEAAVTAMGVAGHAPRLRLAVRGRPTAFFRVGPVLEAIESPVRTPALFGVALVTDEPLETVVLRWRSLGRDVGDPRPALQPGRRIFTVHATEAGLAVMSPERAVG